MRTLRELQKRADMLSTATLPPVIVYFTKENRDALEEKYNQEKYKGRNVIFLDEESLGLL